MPREDGKTTVKDFGMICTPSSFLHVKTGMLSSEMKRIPYSPKPYTGERHQDAKLALSRMKSALKTLGAVTTSLELSIQSLSHDCIEEERAIGFASFPDELLARVFEFYSEYYLWTFDHTWEDARDSPMVLAGVCRRFQRIVLRIPSLWACVSSDFAPERIYTLRTRCQNPTVFLKSEVESSKQDIVDFVKQLHPNAQWRGLCLEYEAEEDGCLLIESLDSEADSPFEALSTLSISYEGFLVDDDSPPPVFPMKCDKILSKWSMPKLNSLELSNIIPSKRLQCPALKSCKIRLSNFIDYTVRWDLKHLQTFIRSSSLDSVEDLTVIFNNTQTANVRSETRQHTLFNLTSLDLRVEADTDPKALKQFMGMIDAPILKKLEIGLGYSQKGDNTLLLSWLNAIFQPSEGLIRTFPNVLEFKLSVQVSDVPDLPCFPMLRALPRLNSLSMAIPGVRFPDLSHLKRSFGCIQELENLHLENCLSPHSGSIFEYGPLLENLRKVELDGCCGGLVEHRQKLQSLLGDKLVWKH